MARRTLMAVLGLGASLLGSGTVEADFVRLDGVLYTTVELDGQMWNVWHVYALVDDPADEIDAIQGGSAGHLLITTSSGSFYQNETIGVNDVEPRIGALAQEPSLAFDTFVTIGATIAPGLCRTMVVLEDQEALFGDEELYIMNGAWFRVPGDPRAVAGPEPAAADPSLFDVLIGQFTIPVGATLDGVAAVAGIYDGKFGFVEDATFSLSAGANASCWYRCPGDADGDNEIGVDDLIVVLLSFGLQGGPADFDASGIVDVDDLLTAILFWGGCDGPPNDSCNNAIELTPGRTPFCTIDATSSGEAEGLCDFFGYDEINHDVWYRYTAPANGQLRIRTCGLADFDTKIALYSLGLIDSCQFKTIEACNDDACGLQSEIVEHVNADSTYLVRVGGFIGGAGSGVLDVEFIPYPIEPERCLPINRVCSIGCLDTRYGSTSISDGSFDDSTCAANDTRDVWYCYTARCFEGPWSIEFSTCNPGTDFDTTIAVYAQSNECGELIEVACNDDTFTTSCELPNGLNRKSRVTVVDPGDEGDVTTWFVRIAGYDGAVGDYELSISTTCPPAMP